MLENLTARVREDLEKDLSDSNYNSVAVKSALITSAAALAHHGLLGNIDCIELWEDEVDLSSVPTRHLASLISNVTGKVMISYNIRKKKRKKKKERGCDLLPILERLKCEELHLFSQHLGREETQALMRAMESCLKDLVLVHCDVKTPDMEALIEKCGHVKCYLELETMKDHDIRCFENGIELI